MSKPAEPYAHLVNRLSRMSVEKHHDAYADVAWDDPENQIDPTDPRWEQGSDHPLGATEWYRSLPQETRAKLGLHLVVDQLKVGIDFESVLQRGLLELAGTLPNGSPEFRYAYHEVIEEGHHSLMFQEFINRTGLPARGLTGIVKLGSLRVPRLGRVFPELFFMHVLGGETPIDHVQRAELRRKNLHPLLRRIMQIHVTEEARHVCFARRYLEEHVPRLGVLARLKIRIWAPFVLRDTALMMLRPSDEVVRAFAIPRAVMAEAYGRGARFKQLMIDGLAPVRDVLRSLGLLPPRLDPVWRLLGIAPAPTPALCLAS